ncbi:MAG: helix-turn-helix domain-containing protein [Gemmatimonadota bacterium]
MSDNEMPVEKALSDLGFVRDADAARSLLDPLRRTILARLEEPGSSSTVANALDLPRQRVNYHVRELEGGGLLRHVEDRRRGNCLERVVQATARRYVVDPGVLGTLAPFEGWRGGRADSYSSVALLRSAALTLAKVGTLHEEAATTGKRLPALCLEARIRFRTARDEVEFAETVERVFRRLVSRYHEPEAEGGRTFRVTLHGHPDPEGSAESSPDAPKSGSAEIAR